MPSLPIDDFREETPVAVAAIEDRRPLRELEADLHRVSRTARSTFEELGSLLRDAEAQHDAALSRQADEYARLKAIELEHWQFYEAFVQAATHGVFRATADGRLLELNPSMAATLGYDSPADLLAASDAIGVADGRLELGRGAGAVARAAGRSDRHALAGSRSSSR